MIHVTSREAGYTQNFQVSSLVRVSLFHMRVLGAFFSLQACITYLADAALSLYSHVSYRIFLCRNLVSNSIQKGG